MQHHRHDCSTAQAVEQASKATARQGHALASGASMARYDHGIGQGQDISVQCEQLERVTGIFVSVLVRLKPYTFCA